jgi:hypothetical protein
MAAIRDRRAQIRMGSRVRDFTKGEFRLQQMAPRRTRKEPEILGNFICLTSVKILLRKGIGDWGLGIRD